MLPFPLAVGVDPLSFFFLHEQIKMETKKGKSQIKELNVGLNSLDMRHEPILGRIWLATLCRKTIMFLIDLVS